MFAWGYEVVDVFDSIDIYGCDIEYAQLSICGVDGLTVDCISMLSIND